VPIRRVIITLKNLALKGLVSWREMNSLERVFKDFLESYCSEEPPLLLGLSGGPDSMALFHLLLSQNYPFEVAHLDHGWREESGKEADYLRTLCQENQIVFHLKKNDKPLEKKNLEEKGREARLTFFKEVLEKRPLKGLFLAHHADDQAEIILKRIFEGATLPKIKGLTPIKELKGMTLFRPFLKIRKGEIIHWLESKNIFYFEDVSNHDPHFLRARMRDQLLPTLSQRFGKEISPSLCRIGQAAAELSEFLEELTQPYLAQVQEKDGLISLNLKQNYPSHAYLLKAVVRQFFNDQQIGISQTNVETIVSHLQKGSCHKSLMIGGHCVKIDRKCLSIKKRCKNHYSIERERQNTL
jgi:tRNA(Ile)-lysidine synthase